MTVDSTTGEYTTCKYPPLYHTCMEDCCNTDNDEATPTQRHVTLLTLLVIAASAIGVIYC